MLFPKRLGGLESCLALCTFGAWLWKQRHLCLHLELEACIEKNNWLAMGPAMHDVMKLVSMCGSFLQILLRERSDGLMNGNVHKVRG